MITHTNYHLNHRKRPKISHFDRKFEKRRNANANNGKIGATINRRIFYAGIPNHFRGTMQILRQLNGTRVEFQKTFGMTPCVCVLFDDGDEHFGRRMDQLWSRKRRT